MNTNTICIEKLEKAYISNPNRLTASAGDQRSLALQANIMGLGYIMDDTLLRAVSGLSDHALAIFAESLVDTLKKLKGANVEHKPMYPNFPRQVMEASDLELFINAITHYWTFGTWKPFYNKNDRSFAFENTQFRTIGLATDEEFDSIFTNIVGSNESISERDKEIVDWFMNNSKSPLVFPEEIPFKETMCIIGAYMIKNGLETTNLVKNATDVLRIATYMSDGDVSLAQNTKFKSFKRSQRRNLVTALDKVATLEDLNRHAGKWVKLGHSLHVGEYSNRLHGMFKKIRENEKIRTFNSDVEMHLSNNHPVKATKLLINRPGDFARRLDHLLRLAKKIEHQNILVNAFLKVSDEVSTRVLLQLLGHFNTRYKTQDHRVVFPKGSIQKAELIDANDPLPLSVMADLLEGIENTLTVRFGELDDLGKVYIDSALLDCPIPTQQRSAGKGTFDLARGTKLPIADDKSTLRFFIYWVGRDIDLSTVFYDENFEFADSVSYMNLHSAGSGTYHSGDIVRAPNGASEFIDIDMEKALSKGIRYVAMSVLVYSGPTFKDHETCFAGWMTRSEPNSNEIYDPKTVEYKLDLNSESKSSIPVIFDLYERKAIWTDLTHELPLYRVNNIHANKASMQDVVKAITTNNNKVDLRTLFQLHARGRGTLVTTPEEADIVFSWDGDVKPSDVNTINSKFIV